MSTNKTANYGLNHWVLSDKPVMAEFNRDNELVDAQLKKLWDSKADCVTWDWKFYVSKGGSDATADGTQAKPFGTIQAAVNFAGRKVAVNAKYILIGDGVYEEQVHVVGCDKLIIRSVSENRNNVVIKPPVGSHGVILNGVASCDISALTIKMPAGSNDRKNALYIYGGSACVYNVAVTSEGKTALGVVFHAGASGFVYDSEISSCNNALRASNGSSLHSRNNSGSGNTITFTAHAATIFQEGTVPGADRASAVAAGGQIYS